MTNGILAGGVLLPCDHNRSGIPSFRYNTHCPVQRRNCLYIYQNYYCFRGIHPGYMICWQFWAVWQLWSLILLEPAQQHPWSGMPDLVFVMASDWLYERHHLSRYQWAGQRGKCQQRKAWRSGGFQWKLCCRRQWKHVGNVGLNTVFHKGFVPSHFVKLNIAEVVIRNKIVSGAAHEWVAS